MFIQISIVILTIVSVLLLNNLFKYNYTLKLEPTEIKYPLTEQDINYFKKYGKELSNQKKLPQKGVFYTTSKWNKNNYYKYNDKYYMIEPGFYYNIIKDSEFFIENINIIFIE